MQKAVRWQRCLLQCSCSMQRLHSDMHQPTSAHSPKWKSPRMHTVLAGSERHTVPSILEAGKPPQDERLRVLLAVRMPALNAAADALLQLQPNLVTWKASQ